MIEGTNVTREDILFFEGQFIKAKDAIKLAQKQRKLIRQHAKNSGIEIEMLDRVIALKEQEDDTTLEQFKTIRLYGSYLNLPIGTQMTFAGDERASRKATEDDTAKARREGYERGIKGLNPDEQAYPPLSPLGIAHIEGWHEGQGVLLTRIKQLDETAVAPSRRGRPRKGKVEDAASTEPESDTAFTEH